jgi:hypothetical protein
MQDVDKKKIFIILAIIVLIGVLFYVIWTKFWPSKQENYTLYTDYMLNNVQDIVYPNYFYYNVKIDPPMLEWREVKEFGADENGYCTSCFNHAYIMKTIRDYGYWYNFKAKNYTDALEEAAIYKIEVNPTLPSTESLYNNPFYFFFTFNNTTGILDSINIYTYPSESEINKMSFEEVKNFKHMIENINVSSIYPSLSNKDEYCFWFHPWQISHSIYTITVPNGIINHTVDDKDKCNISVSNEGSKITVKADCKLYTVDLCPSVQWTPQDPMYPWRGFPLNSFSLDNCFYPKVEICFK